MAELVLGSEVIAECDKLMKQRLGHKIINNNLIYLFNHYLMDLKRDDKIEQIADMYTGILLYDLCNSLKAISSVLLQRALIKGVLKDLAIYTNFMGYQLNKTISVYFKDHGEDGRLVITINKSDRISAPELYVMHLILVNNINEEEELIKFPKMIAYEPMPEKQFD